MLELCSYTCASLDNGRASIHLCCVMLQGDAEISLANLEDAMAMVGALDYRLPELSEQEIEMLGNREVPPSVGEQLEKAIEAYRNLKKVLKGELKAPQTLKTFIRLKCVAILLKLL